jgi:hypothetical protein
MRNKAGNKVMNVNSISRTTVNDDTMTKQLFLLLNKVLVGKPEGKRPLQRPRRRWDDNINLEAPKFSFKF